MWTASVFLEISLPLDTYDFHVFIILLGSILAVTYANPYAAGKKDKFVGICMYRTHMGLRASFTLRNMVDNQGKSLSIL